MSEQFNNLFRAFKRISPIKQLSINLSVTEKVSFAGKVVGRESPDSPAPISNNKKTIDPLVQWINDKGHDSPQQSVLASLSLGDKYIRTLFVNQNKCSELGEAIEALSQRKAMRR